MRFGDRVLPFTDVHGMRVALIESGRAVARPFTPWEASPVPVAQQIRGLHGAQLWERDVETTAVFLKEALGFELLATEGGWHRYGFAGHPGVVDLKAAPEARRGAWGVGSVHHLAWAVQDGAQQLAMRAQVEAHGGRATEVIDRFWFQSVYFKEPGGVLFELATEGPGFAVDEDPAHLGESLVLPPWYEPARPQIEAALPPLHAPAPLETR
jgi:glyoxalase family protein